MSETRQIADFEDAVLMLPDSDTIHVSCNPSVNVILGADWSKEGVLSEFRKNKVELSGPIASSIGHGLCFRNENGWWFVETKKEVGKQ